MPVFLWVELYLFLVVGRTASGGVFCSVCEISMTSGSLSANGWGCVPILLVVWHGASSIGACWQWVELGLNVEMKISGRALAS